MTEQQPKPGEWWWLRSRCDGNVVLARFMRSQDHGDGRHRWKMFGGAWAADGAWEPVRPMADIPPAPEPSEREKVDARRADAIYGLCTGQEHEIVCAIRASDEAAGYVLAPTSGPGFEAMAESLQRAFSGLLTIGSAKHLLRAALESLKGEGR